MTALFLRELGLLREDVAVLDVGAGSEPLMFWLARHAGRVVATDIYGEGDFAYREAAGSFVADPSRFAPYDYPRERLEVRHADARELPFDDATFDVVVSMSSIEHFGGPGGIRRSAAEIGRVLKPGGYAFLVTEVFVTLDPLHSAAAGAALRAATLGRRLPGHGLGQRPIDGFTARDVERLVVGPSGLRMVQPLDLAADDPATSNVQMMQPDGGTRTASGEPFPHVMLGARGTRWTSACLPLVKPG
jgi:SAM-dependent methyltransferase